MMGEARFRYTDRDMVATLGAGWATFARPRNLFIAYVLLAAFDLLTMRPSNAVVALSDLDPTVVILAPAVEVVLVFGALYLVGRNRARRILHSNYALAWFADKLRGEQAWTWDPHTLHLRYDRGHADLAWTSVGAWLDAPEVLLLFPFGSRRFSVLEAEWRNAPKVPLYPYGGIALTLPKRALAAEDAGRLVEVLRAAGVREQRRFGLIAAEKAHAGGRFEPKSGRVDGG